MKQGENVIKRRIKFFNSGSKLLVIFFEKILFHDITSLLDISYKKI